MKGLQKGWKCEEGCSQAIIGGFGEISEPRWGVRGAESGREKLEESKAEAS